MQKKLQPLFWIELILSLASAAALAMTIVSPRWIETYLGFEPDGGDGSTEWGWAIGLSIATIILFALTGREWRKARPDIGI